MHRRTAETAWRKCGDHARTTQTGCALALRFDIVPTAERAAVGEALAALVRTRDGRIATGFLGTPFVLPVLTGTGHTDEAYRLLLNPECPGRLYQVVRGATTMWERWDAMQPDGTIDVENAGTMLSFHHYAYGAVAAWLYQPRRHRRPGHRCAVPAPVRPLGPGIGPKSSRPDRERHPRSSTQSQVRRVGAPPNTAGHQTHEQRIRFRSDEVDAPPAKKERFRRSETCGSGAGGTRTHGRRIMSPFEDLGDPCRSLLILAVSQLRRGLAPQSFSALVSLFRSLCPTCVQNASRMGTLTRFTDPLPS
ncbi:hypothetical protein OG889_30695 [Streptomyces sp. NBC_00481]|uniref:alpha-L-rhamnosidase-related protein n=1 Tax=Streptomyces sp. NBC_00481 TaxID=2975755 RepID=UPI002DD7CD22|nr:hypothetical protein [Streptomyces sp. NBC_00481]WRZ01651.1 hypothetical protein OG889_30695 [Streptomyces sp. NBC_00481]